MKYITPLTTGILAILLVMLALGGCSSDKTLAPYAPPPPPPPINYPDTIFVGESTFTPENPFLPDSLDYQSFGSRKIELGEDSLWRIDYLAIDWLIMYNPAGEQNDVRSFAFHPTWGPVPTDTLKILVYQYGVEFPDSALTINVYSMSSCITALPFLDSSDYLFDLEQWPSFDQICPTMIKGLGWAAQCNLVGQLKPSWTLVMPDTLVIPLDTLVTSVMMTLETTTPYQVFSFLPLY